MISTKHRYVNVWDRYLAVWVWCAIALAGGCADDGGTTRADATTDARAASDLVVAETGGADAKVGPGGDAAQSGLATVVLAVTGMS